MDWSKLILVSLASCSFCLSSPSAEAEAGYGYRSYGYGGHGRSYRYGGHRPEYSSGRSHSGITRHYGYKFVGGVPGQGVEMERGAELGERQIKLASVTRNFMRKTTRPSQSIRVKQTNRLVKPTKLEEMMTPKTTITVKQVITPVQSLTEIQTSLSDEQKRTKEIMKPDPILSVKDTVLFSDKSDEKAPAQPSFPPRLPVITSTTTPTPFPFPPRLPVITTTTTPRPLTFTPPSSPPSPPPPPSPAPSPMLPQPIPAVPGRTVISESDSMTGKSNFILRPVTDVPGLLSFSEQPV